MALCVIVNLLDHALNKWSFANWFDIILQGHKFFSSCFFFLFLCLEQTYENVLVAFSYTIIYMYSTTTLHLTLKMTAAQVVKTSVTNNSLSKDYLHPDDHAKQITDTPGFKPFTCTCILCKERKTEWVTTKTKIFMGFFLFFSTELHVLHTPISV